MHHVQLDGKPENHQRVPNQNYFKTFNTSAQCLLCELLPLTNVRSHIGDVKIHVVFISSIDVYLRFSQSFQ